ncbi:unnamed protein product, partial [Meganyctiphanes norvegica]
NFINLNMIAKVVCGAVLLVACVAAQHGNGGGGYGKPPGMPYDFAYGVRDEYRGVNFAQDEENDGQVTRGSYTVQLPDGRTQIVTYEADHDNGHRANVEYIGEAQFPHEFPPPVTFKPQASGYQKPQQQQSYQPPKQSGGYQ